MDQIDQQLISLLKERVRISRKIGHAKRLKNVPIYAPDRERDVIDRILELNNSELHPTVLRSIYREILAGSRQAQSPPPLGYLGAESVYWSARSHLGTAEILVKHDQWKTLSEAIKAGQLAGAILPTARLGQILAKAPKPERFLKNWTLINLFSTVPHQEESLEKSIAFIAPSSSVTPSQRPCNRILVLIRCKLPETTLQNFQSVMAESLTAPFFAIGNPVDGAEPTTALALLSAAPAEKQEIIAHLNKTASASLLPTPLVMGVFWHGDLYGG